MANLGSSSNPPQDKLKSEILDRFSHLPDELVQECLARVPRSCYRSLSSVCKSWHNQIHSESLYSTRKTLKVIDFSLLLKVRVESVGGLLPFYKWYEFFPLFNYNIARGLFKLPLPLPCVQPTGSSAVSVGTKIYIIDGMVDHTATKTMLVYDVISDQWEYMISQREVYRYYPSLEVVNNKIYVMGGCERSDPNWAEVFDLKTRNWSSLPSPNLYGLPEKAFLKSCALVKRKIMCFFYDLDAILMLVLEFDTSSSVWTELPSTNYKYWDMNVTAVIDEVFYCSIDFEIWGYLYKNNEWKKLRLMEGVLPAPMNVEKMVNMNGKLVVLWKNKFKRVWDSHCAVIEVRKDDESAVLSGFVVWAGFVGRVVTDYADIVDCFAVGL